MRICVCGDEWPLDAEGPVSDLCDPLVVGAAEVERLQRLLTQLDEERDELQAALDQQAEAAAQVCEYVWAAIQSMSHRC